MRHNLDLLAAHSREMIRHGVMMILLAGTVSGTVWTFSAGGLTLAGAWERIVSVGGIALALEIGGVFTGLYIQALDARIQSARRRDTAEAYRAYKRTIYRWFAAILMISFVANLLFRYQQLHNLALAAFVSLAPIVLICLFTIVLRPLPVDYAELSRQATQRGLLLLVRNSQSSMLAYMRDVGRGRTPSLQKQQGMAIATAFLATYAQPAEQQALDYAKRIGSGDNVVDTTAEEVWDSADLQRLYDISPRSAQAWMQATPARRRAERGNRWLVPASVIVGAHGAPKPSESHYSASSGKTQRTQRDAGVAQMGALDTRIVAVEAQ